MKNKAGFLSAISGDLNRGILRLIYESEALCVLSVADSFYVASDYTESGEGYVAFLVNSKMVRAMLVDSEFLTRLLTTSDQQTLSQMMFRLTPTTFRTFRNTRKRRADQELTHKFVDHELEQWILDTFGAPESAVAAGEKKGLFDSVRNLFSK